MTCDSGIYHGKANADLDTVYKPHSTRRPPSNVPYLVDNLWEWEKWKRNKNGSRDYPSRRNAKFASPSPEQARDAAYLESLDQVYCVEFRGEATVAQMTTEKDAKKHDDVRDLRALIVRMLDGEEGRYSWVSRKMEQKADAGRLFRPCLEGKEVERVLREVDVFDPEKIRDEIGFWDEVVSIEPEHLDNDVGEIFFEYPGGFKLHPLDGAS